jgi:hypothetical protein
LPVCELLAGVDTCNQLDYIQMMMLNMFGQLILSFDGPVIRTALAFSKASTTSWIKMNNAGLVVINSNNSVIVIRHD